jgi:hypothetical protein
VIHCHGQTIIPGLISDHSHIGLVDGVSVKPENYNRENILRQLRQYEAYGVTTIMALGLNGDLFYQLRDEQLKLRLEPTLERSPSAFQVLLNIENCNSWWTAVSRRFKRWSALQAELPPSSG